MHKAMQVSLSVCVCHYACPDYGILKLLVVMYMHMYIFNFFLNIISISLPFFLRIIMYPPHFY